MASTSEIRNGLCIDHNNDIFSVVEFQHVKPGKGAAFVRTKLKSMTNGKVLDHTFPAGHKISIVRVERRKYQYLYNDTYEQTMLPVDLIENPGFLLEGSEVEILFHSEKEIPLQMELPQNIEVEVTYTEPGLRGDTATNTLKPATIETGAEVKVPLFINTGDKIKIDTRSGEYAGRV